MQLLHRVRAQRAVPIVALLFAACGTEPSTSPLQPAGLLADARMAGCTPGADHANQGQGVVPDSVLAVRCSAQPGDIIWVTLGELKPTQPSLGYDEVYYKLGRYAFGSTYATWDGVKNKRFGDWCEASGLLDVQSATTQSTLQDPTSFSCKLAPGAETAASRDLMKSVVIGPHGVAYLTDGHHTFTSFVETPDGGPNTRVRVRVDGNLSSLSTAAFWNAMEENGWVWLFDENDAPISRNQLPSTLGLDQFGNDPYRGAMYFARDVGYFQVAGNALFQEFRIGRWLRGQTADSLSLASHDLTDLTSYLGLVRAISRSFVSLPNDFVMADGRTAQQLGKLPTFSTSEFNKLSVPFNLATPNAKPGKLGYALQYKNTVALATAP